jgi:hypothetical protein
MQAAAVAYQAKYTHSPILTLRTIIAQLIPRKPEHRPIMAKYATSISNVHEMEKTHTTATVSDPRNDHLTQILTFYQPAIQCNAQATPSSTQDDPHAATSIVLSTTELLEQILSHLDVQDFIILRRVSCHWRDVLSSSLILQRAMLLAPEPELDFEWHLKARCPDLDCRDQRRRYVERQRGTTPAHGDTVMESARFNPLMFERRLESECICICIGDRIAQQSVSLYPRSCFINAGANELFARMLISQPPVTHARVGCRTGLINERGIKVKDVNEAMEGQRDSTSKDPYKRQGESTSGGLARHFASVVVEDTVFPDKDEEAHQQRHPANLGQWYQRRCSAESEKEENLEEIIRFKGIRSGYCTDWFRERISVVGLE